MASETVELQVLSKLWFYSFLLICAFKLFLVAQVPLPTKKSCEVRKPVTVAPASTPAASATLTQSGGTAAAPTNAKPQNKKEKKEKKPKEKAEKGEN